MRHPFFTFSFIALVLTGFLAYTFLQLGGLPIGVSYLISINLVTFVLYWYDMLISPAKDERTRIPEWVLLGLVLVGGTFGGILGMLLFRHKINFRRKWWFQLRLFLIVVLQFLLLYYCSPIGQPNACNNMLGSLMPM